MPKYVKARLLPYHYKDKVDKSLQELLNNNIIKQIDSSDWAHPIVPVVKPNGTVRLCVDFKYLNTQSEINQFPLPLVDDILSDIGPCKFISKIDLTNAYLQLKVSEESQKLLVINTHKGLFRFERLPFGLAAAPAIFQKFMNELIAGRKGIYAYLDDILVVGSTEKEHDSRLIELLQLLKSRNVNLNKNKCIIKAKQVPFLGYILTTDGIKPNSDKTVAIHKAPRPDSVQALRSFLGMCVYYNRFISNFSSILAPLYNLTMNNVPFVWSAIHEQAFCKIKKELGKANLLSNYNPDSELILEVDASPIGIGSVLKQKINDKISTIAFASKKLSQSECNYSQIDKEAYAIIFGVRKFSKFLLGRKFTIKSDHKPLIHLFSPAKNIPQMYSARIQRWALYLSSFNFQIKHISGKDNKVADALSRLPIHDENDIFKTPGEFVNLINVLETSNISFSNIQKCTNNDSVLKVSLNYIRNGFPKCKNLDVDIKPFHNIKDHLTIHDDVVLFNNRVIIPHVLRKSIMNHLHEGHKGIVAMKEEARKFVYWPHMDQDIEEITKHCKECIINYVPKGIKPLSWPETNKAWSRIHIDYCGPIDNLNFLIIIDSHTKFIDVHAVKSITSDNTIQLLKTCFSNFGIPDQIVSDNATCFTSQEFKKFINKNGIKHLTGAPYNPSTNGLAERAVRVFKVNLKKFLCKLSIKDRINKFLYSYRRTTQSSTGHTPAELMFGRNFKGPLDIVLPNKAEKDKLSFENSSFKVGDAVFARNFGKGSEWVEGVIKQVLGLKNYLIQVSVNGNLTWKRHETQIFSREIYPESHDKIKTNNENIVMRYPSKITTSDINIENTPQSEQIIDNSTYFRNL